MGSLTEGENARVPMRVFLHFQLVISIFCWRRKKLPIPYRRMVDPPMPLLPVVVVAPSVRANVPAAANAIFAPAPSTRRFSNIFLQPPPLTNIFYPPPPPLRRHIMHMQPQQPTPRDASK